MRKRINLSLMVPTDDILRIVEEESYDVKEYFNLLKDRDIRYYEHFLHKILRTFLTLGRFYFI